MRLEFSTSREWEPTAGKWFPLPNPAGLGSGQGAGSRNSGGTLLGDGGGLPWLRKAASGEEGTTATPLCKGTRPVPDISQGFAKNGF